MSRRPLIAGNWKMFGRRADLSEIRALSAATTDAPSDLELAICPPVTLLAAAVEAAAGSRIGMGGQDCRAGGDGAFTGDVNAAMLVDAGAVWCIVGHSERRQGHGETDADVAAKAKAAMAAGLTPIICIGETLEERQAGQAAAVVQRQIAGSVPADAPSTVVVAYEPVWAIGTGLTPTLGEIADTHAAIRVALADGRQGAEGIRILYGGSVKPGNAAEIFRVNGVDGALVGGASLKAADFAAIIAAHPAAARR
ncbi:MAG: triose-phosphate isomerase [Hyphomonadaceae bacterium]|nr:triose-phosphate isomerase [Hyphomonadaceae bacterium]